MLVNPAFLWLNLGHVVSLTLLVLIGKVVIVLLLGLLFPRPARTFLVVAVGLSQIGEFSFILGQGGLSLHLLSSDQYSLILAAALLSITANPFMYKLLPVLERMLRRIPGFWRQLESNKPLPEINVEQLNHHAVIIGYGRAGKHLVEVLQALAVPLLVIETDTEAIADLNQRNIPTLYGDAGNSEVVIHAHLDQASVLVCTVPDEATTTLVVTAARDINPNLPIVVRAATEEGVRYLADAGANHIVQPELEGGLEMIHHTLLNLGFPLREVHQYLEAVRQDHYETNVMTDDEYRSIHELLRAIQGIEIVWMELNDSSHFIGKSIEDANICSQTGASIVALIRNKQLIANPKSMTVFKAGDRVGVIGDPEQIELFQNMILG
jgi:CPA2 family monovalent cation:H+ antiporter-2